LVVNTLSSETVDAFADLVTRPEEQIDLATAAFTIARVEYPDLDVREQSLRLRELGRRAAGECPDASSPHSPDRMCAYVFGELGFRGNLEDYYDPRNSYLNDVLDRRVGIPISLAVVYLEIAKACGRETDAVGFPGNFLVRDRISGVLLDPFNAGREITKDDCARLFAKYETRAGRSEEEALAAVGTRAVLTRMIANLLRIHIERDAQRQVGELRAMVDLIGETQVESIPNLQ
jgi:regulator of sirC expression with transglutaminase-like and TPR domain